MMSNAIVRSFILLLPMNILSNSDTIKGKINFDTSKNLINCTNPNPCPLRSECAICEKGRGPECTYTVCTNGKCGFIEKCSQNISLFSVVRSSIQCMGTDTSLCSFNKSCAICPSDYSPNCTEIVCLNNECQIIPTCSIYTPTLPIVSHNYSIASSHMKCRTDSDCLYTESCLDRCEDGFEPLCGTAKCISENCEFTLPCSIKSECTSEDLSKCMVTEICNDCQIDYGPRCTETTCKNGKCKAIPPCSVYAPMLDPLPHVPSMISSHIKCNKDADCLYNESCHDRCENGFEPLCGYGKCISEKCEFTAPCSIKSECTDRDTSECIVASLCVQCASGFGPKCAKAECKKGKCKTISPCSLYDASLNNEILNEKSNQTAEMSTVNCQKDPDCPFKKQCADKCNEDSYPLCTLSRCIYGKCELITPCSRKFECTNTNLTNCIVPHLCIRCKSGYGPPCIQAACIDNQCIPIMPCSTLLTKTLKIGSRTDQCTHDSDCSIFDTCVSQCTDNTIPTCASVKCIDGKCKNVKACSKSICKTDATCSYNQFNCATCANGYGPTCERANCIDGICSIVPPCSKKSTLMAQFLSRKRK